MVIIMNDFLSKYFEADELHVSTYGDSFLQDMLNLIENEFISQEEALKIIQCLIDIDEIRIILGSEIRELIITYVSEEGYNDCLLSLLYRMSDAYINQNSNLYKKQMQEIIYGILDNKYSIQTAKNMIK